MRRTLSRLLGLAVLGAVGAAGWRAWRSRCGRDARPGVPPIVDPGPVSIGEPQPDPDEGPATWVAPVDGECPEGYPIKVNERSGIYHVPGGLSYDRTRPTRCYPDPEAAEADDFRRARR